MTETDDTVVVMLAISFNRKDVEGGFWPLPFENAVARAHTAASKQANVEIFKRGWVIPPPKDPVNG